MVRGKKVGKYELGRTLGSGSFSKVKLGIDDKGRQYAVKIIEKEQLVREHMEEQLKREISVMKMLKHPHTVQLYDVLQTQNHIYLVLELVTGGELFDRILSAKRFDEDTARRFFQQMVVALHFSHRNGVAHRDLKPENLLVDDKDNIKVTDFGLANLQKPDKLLHTVCGTPNYVAPEVLKECGYNGIYADTWSCGIILFVMLAGYLPFDDPQLDELFKKIQRGDYRMCKTFTEPVKDIITKMLNTDPKKRITLDGVMRHPWFCKNFDRSVFDSLNGTKSSVNVESVDQHTNGNVAKESELSAKKQEAMDANANIQVGAFDLISQLTSTAMVSVTSSQPVIKIYTRFFLGCAPSEASKKLVAALDGLKANPKVRDEFEVKGFVNCNKGLMTYVVTLVPTVASSLTIIEVRRGRGDTFDFHGVYHALIGALGSDVKSKALEDNVS
jgi:serine/threonine protein kinase